MVGFSCDHCQDVFTRAKIDRHFERCRTYSVSCIGCGAVFNSRTVKGHTSCIMEAEKYEGRGKLGERRPNTNSYCGVCDQVIPGLVAGEQHYSSKKHRTQQRRLKEQNKSKKSASRTFENADGKINCASLCTKTSNAAEGLRRLRCRCDGRECP